MTDLRDRTVTVVGQAVDHDGRAAGSVTFVAHLHVLDAVQFARAALDGTLDVVLGHALRLGLVDSQPQTRIRGQITAAGTRRDRDLLDQLREELAALLVLGALAMLDVRPFAVSCHSYPKPDPDTPGSNLRV